MVNMQVEDHKRPKGALNHTRSMVAPKHRTQQCQRDYVEDGFCLELQAKHPWV